METVLEAKSLSKEFPGLMLFKDLSLTVSAGESVAIVGKSGSGKSTLLHILGTLEKPSQGEVFFPQAKKASLETLRSRQIGFVFQSFALLEDYTLLENLLMPGKIAGLPLLESKKTALELLEVVDLLNKKDLPAKLLSGGEKQRGALARALCNNPDILLVDEPTGNLDPKNAQIVEDLLFTCCEKYNKALILVTHDLQLARKCSKCYELKEGLLQCL